MAHAKHNFEICEWKIEGERVFLQYFDVFSHEDTRVNYVDKNLGCIRLIWDRSVEGSDTERPGRKYELTQLDSIRERVSVACAIELKNLLQNNVPYKKKLVDLCSIPQGALSSVEYILRSPQYIGFGRVRMIYIFPALYQTCIRLVCTVQIQ